ncbi:MAG: co-chaperone GroES [Gemmatimonadetes bacterium]|nr:co-chaperone GroES [Gemmatimonadota bacterium]
MAVKTAPAPLKPISDFLLVAMDPPPEDGVIILAGGAKRDNVPQTGVVIAQGPGLTLPSGQVAAMPCQPGDRVVLQLNAGTEIKLEGREYRVVPARDLFGVKP